MQVPCQLNVKAIQVIMVQACLLPPDEESDAIDGTGKVCEVLEKAAGNLIDSGP